MCMRAQSPQIYFEYFIIYYLSKVQFVDNSIYRRISGQPRLDGIAVEKTFQEHGRAGVLAYELVNNYLFLGFPYLSLPTAGSNLVRALAPNDIPALILCGLSQDMHRIGIRGGIGS